MRTKWLVWSTGFALFSMFFGSGNLVFPLSVGFESEGHFIFGALGIILTGVIVPFLGVFGMLLYKGDLQKFFSIFGKKGTLIFSFCLLALMGPFGVLARCLTVAHGALLLLFPELSLPVASFFMCSIIFILSANENKIVKIIGAFLTPFLLFAIGTIVFCAMYQGNLQPVATPSALPSFTNGFYKGYMIMDLLAAFFFSHFIIKNLYTITNNNEEKSLSVFFKASFIGAALLASVYFVLVQLGWLYAPLLNGKPAQEFLGIIAFESLGNLAGPMVCLAVIFACLTTAIILTSLFSEFLKNEICANKINHKISLFVTLFIGFMVSTLEFEGIGKVLGPIMEIIYPGLIVLTIYNIIYNVINRKRLVAEGS